jgi:YggT family protein
VTITLLQQFLVSLGLVYTAFIIVHVILGMLQLGYSPWLGRVRSLTFDTVEPYLRVWRNVLPPMGGLDLSPLIGIFAVNIAVQIAIVIVGSFG